MAYLREVRGQFWSQVRAGASIAAAAKDCGLFASTGRRWFHQAGGVVPEYVPALPTSCRLTIAKREEIAVLAAQEKSIRAIARAIECDPATVLRELRRNGFDYRSRRELDPTPRKGARRVLPCGYRARGAQLRADNAAARPKPGLLVTLPKLGAQVQEWLKEKFSPEQISKRLKLEFADDVDMQVSHETIYQSIYVQAKGGFKKELTTCLRTGRALRRPRRKSGERRGQIQGAISISERPAEVEDRALPGHWEGDLLMGKNGRSAIGTLVERTTRYLILLHLAADFSAEAVERAMIEATQRLPQDLWKTLTWDRGFEMRNHARISIATDLEIYFCDPSSPWQRGTNENTNGLLRQYFPKGTDLSGYHPEYLEFVSAQMNRRPRKTLDWNTPAEALNRLLSDPSDPRGVALTG